MPNYGLAEVDSTDASVTAALDRMPDLLEMFSGGTTPEPVENFAPADQAAFAELLDRRPHNRGFWME